MNNAEIYYALRRLIEDQPDHTDAHGVMKWLGKSVAVAAQLDRLDAGELTAISSTMHMAGNSPTVEKTNAVLYRLLAKAELLAPVAEQGSFVAAGNPLDAMAAIGKVLREAQTSVRIVDPYMDEKTLTDFAVLAPEGVAIELLSDATYTKPSFAPAVRRFKDQFGPSRPLQARLSPGRQLHDRIIQTDGEVVYSVTQSLNALATRSPASIIRVDGDTARLKMEAYQAFWDAASAI